MSEEQLEHKFFEWVEQNGGKLDHQISDIPYSNGVFKTTDGKTVVITLAADDEGFYGE